MVNGLSIIRRLTPVHGSCRIKGVIRLDRVITAPVLSWHSARYGRRLASSRKLASALLVISLDRTLVQMQTYELEHWNHDVLQGVYQQLVDPKDRRFGRILHPGTVVIAEVALRWITSAGSDLAWHVPRWE
jgi:hypothetical protein